jgi:hypothetical protein
MISELCPGQNSKCKNKQRAITPKLDQALFRFFMHLRIDKSQKVKINKWEITSK